MRYVTKSGFLIVSNGFFIVLKGFFIENVGHTLTKNYNGTYWPLDRLLTQNRHGKVLNSLDQEGKLILLWIHLKFTLYFAVKLIAVVRI